MTLVRPYFVNRLTGLGFQEWEQPINYDSAPSSLLDRVFHLEEQSFSLIQQDQQSITFSYPMRVRMAFKGFQEPNSALKEAIQKAEIAIVDLCNPIHFGQIAGLTQVVLSSGDFAALDETGNDNVIIADLVFDARVSVCLN